MITETFELIKAWSQIAQFLFIIIMAALGTAVVLALVVTVGEFFTVGLPAILWGFPSELTEETPEETSDKEA